MNSIEVRLDNGDSLTCPANTPVGTLEPADDTPDALPTIACLVNNDLCSLTYPLTVNCTLRFLTAADAHGWRVYRRSLCFLLAKAVRELYPDSDLSVEHSFGLGLYCHCSPDGGHTGGLSPDQISTIEKRMRELVEEDLPIERRKVSYTDAVRQFEQSGQLDKLNLLKYRNPPRIVTHCCKGFSDLAHGPLAPRTGVLSCFSLIPYAPGLVLHLPDRGDPRHVPPFEDQPHLFQIFQEHKEWGRITGVTTVGRLNEIVACGEMDDFIRTAEALHEKKLVKIADAITEARDRVRLILVAGPSSAGKTTFAKRLGVQLRVNGLLPVALSVDNYFVGEEQNPRDEAGNPDYEHLEAVDLDLFNTHLQELSAGRDIELPFYDFETKRRRFIDQRLRLGEGRILIVEGIHGLNPRLTEGVPASAKFKIYISALTQLGVDEHNRISTTDNRLMRRIVRDHKFRGYSALDTLRQWPSVRRGEKRWIFPYQREADATFNSALDYELAVLKPFVEPVLMQVKPAHSEYTEARRLSEFLLNFLGMSDQPVPGTSILREYIGGSSFSY